MSELLQLVEIDKIPDFFEGKLAISLATEKINITKAKGRVLARDVISQIDLPPFSRSTMDGYAVKATDTYGASESMPVYLDLVGEILMGEEAEQGIKIGQAVKIATGGMLPKGADAVVMVEYTEALGEDMIEVFKSVASRENIVVKGEDITQDNLLLKQGHLLRAQDIGALAGIGITEVEVFLKLVVTVFSTGDELVAPEQSPKLGQIRDINTYLVGSLVEETGGTVNYGGIIADNKEELKNRIGASLKNSDLVILSGGSSVGTKDLTIEVLNELGEPGVLVHGISIKPGKPTILALIDNTPVIGLPGHPASAMTVLKIIGTPIIQKLAGQEINQFQGSVSAKLSRNLASDKGREEYIRVKLVTEDGQLWAQPILGKSSLITTMVEADGLVKIDLGKEGLDQGEEVQVLLF
ncbi:gephyrin-like molybdotransferase Glp [Halocella sp. SP3-1]|uniref:molybdopterin molybdotransferase MoeA n=1 Tax=Halocella sp. SP3-1 TaxID=2382161 RepID=UPI000F76337D|nr:gephyrin-like molybdotransferase Glp [Halocella sp. SP3-1]AZO96022.1 molybdopterin molybdenumtransferase MoeA [Halocella sp. SP3-1]